MKKIFLLFVLTIAAPAFAGSVKLIWDAPQDVTVAKYRIYKTIFDSGVNPALAAETGVPFDFVTVYGLLETKSYELFSVSVNADGVESVPSNSVVYTVPITRPVLNVVEIAPGRVKLGWRDLWDNESSYQVEKSTNGGKSFRRFATLPAGVQHVNDFDVQKNGVYHYRIRVKVGSVWSEASRTVEAYTEK